MSWEVAFSFPLGIAVLLGVQAHLLCADHRHGIDTSFVNIEFAASVMLVTAPLTVLPPMNAHRSPGVLVDMALKRQISNQHGTS